MPPDIGDHTSPAHRTDIGDARARQLAPQKRRGFEFFVREFGTPVYLAARRDDDVDNIVRNPVWCRHRVRTFCFPLAPRASSNRITIERHSISFFSYLALHNQKIDLGSAYPLQSTLVVFLSAASTSVSVSPKGSTVLSNALR